MSTAQSMKEAVSHVHYETAAYSRAKLAQDQLENYKTTKATEQAQQSALVRRLIECGDCD